jgi:hypothetical protein
MGTLFACDFGVELVEKSSSMDDFLVVSSGFLVVGFVQTFGRLLCVVYGFRALRCRLNGRSN